MCFIKVPAEVVLAASHPARPSRQDPLIIACLKNDHKGDNAILSALVSFPKSCNAAALALASRN